MREINLKLRVDAHNINNDDSMGDFMLATNSCTVPPLSYVDESNFKVLFLQEK